MTTENFTDLAMERFAKTFPKLSGKVLSFYDLTEENLVSPSQSVGVFVIGIGKSRYYVPVLALNSTVSPIDSVYLPEEQRFLPLIPQIVDYILTAKNKSLGKATKLPQHLAGSPSIRDLVEPPRTGKYLYAGDSLIGEALAQVSPSFAQKFMDVVVADHSLMKDIHRVGVDTDAIEEILESRVAVQDPQINETNSEGMPAKVVSRVEEGLALDDAAKREIVQYGFTVLGRQPFPRLAFEYTKSSEGFALLNAAQEGNVYEFITKFDGSKLGLIVPRATTRDAGEVTSSDRLSLTKQVLFDDGSFSNVSQAVIRSTPRDLDSFMLGMNMAGRCKSTLDLKTDGDTKYMFITPKGFYGPIGIRSITVAGKTLSMTRLDSYHANAPVSRIIVSPNVAQSGVLDSEVLYLKEGCFEILELNGYCEGVLETSLRRATDVEAMMDNRFTEESHVITFDGGEFCVDRKPVGGVVKVAQVLVEDFHLDKAQAHHFIKLAQDKRRVQIQLSKQASYAKEHAADRVSPATNVNTTSADLSKPTINTPMYSEGGQIPADNGDALGERIDVSDRALNTDLIKSAATLNDKNILEGTVMSEILMDYDMTGTIHSYLPVIDQALDKIGRTLFLLRLNNDDMLDVMSAQEYSKLLSSLRNTYRMLGENRLILERMLPNDGES